MTAPQFSGSSGECGLVIIENQFGRTDHGHLGQILTYLAGVDDAKTVVWIAETIQPDHRAAVDWLNTNTDQDFSFFAIEIELWTIDNSPPAPRFNLIASPNDWSKRARRASGRVSKASEERKQIRLAYYASFKDYMKEKGFPYEGTTFPFKTIRTGFIIRPRINVKGRMAVELYMKNDPDKAFFEALLQQKEAIEKELGEALDWKECPGKKVSRIVLWKYDVDPSDESGYPAQHEWMLQRMEKFRDVFDQRVKALPDGATLEGENEEFPDD